MVAPTQFTRRRNMFTYHLSLQWLDKDNELWLCDHVLVVHVPRTHVSTMYMRRFVVASARVYAVCTSGCKLSSTILPPQTSVSLCQSGLSSLYSPLRCARKRKCVCVWSPNAGYNSTGWNITPIGHDQLDICMLELAVMQHCCHRCPQALDYKTRIRFVVRFRSSDASS